MIHPSRQPPAERNPCERNGGCSHLCLIDAPRRRDCACPHLMRLRADGVTCEGKPPHAAGTSAAAGLLAAARCCVAAHEKALVIGRVGEILSVDPDSVYSHAAPTVSAAHVTAPAALQASCAHRSLYWADLEVRVAVDHCERSILFPIIHLLIFQTSEIKRAILGGGGGGPRVVATGGPEGGRTLALDWAAQLLYYGTGAALGVADLRGEYTAYLHPGTMENLTSLAVDPRR